MWALGRCLLALSLATLGGAGPPRQSLGDPWRRLDCLAPHVLCPNTLLPHTCERKEGTQWELVDDDDDKSQGGTPVSSSAAKIMGTPTGRHLQNGRPFHATENAFLGHVPWKTSALKPERRAPGKPPLSPSLPIFLRRGIPPTRSGDVSEITSENIPAPTRDGMQLISNLHIISGADLPPRFSI